MNEHIITVKHGQGKALKCLHCGTSVRLKLKKGLMNFAKELADFSRVHADCKPKPDGRALRYAKPKPPAESPPCCLICGNEFKPMDGKIPLYRHDQLSPAYSHVECYGNVIGGYQVGHHNLIVHSTSEWLYFWQGECGVARNRAEAKRALSELCNKLITNGFIKANEAI